MSSNVTWSDWGDDAVQEQETRINSARDTGSSYFKVKQGDNYLRFLPPLQGQRSPFTEVWQHFIGGQDWPGRVPGREEGKPLVFACPELMLGQHCEACERMRQLKMSRSRDDRDLAYMLRPNLRVFANVVDMDNPSAGVQIFAFTPTVYDGLMEIRKNSRMGGNFTHPETGRVICVTRKGEGKFGTRYSVRAGDREQLEDYAWIEQQHDLSTPVPLLTHEDSVALAGSIDAITSGGASTALPSQGGRKRIAAPAPTEGAARRRRRTETRAQDVLDSDEDY